MGWGDLVGSSYLTLCHVTTSEILCSNTFWCCKLKMTERKQMRKFKVLNKSCSDTGSVHALLLFFPLSWQSGEDRTQTCVHENAPRAGASLLWRQAGRARGDHLEKRRFWGDFRAPWVPKWAKERQRRNLHQRHGVTGRGGWVSN